MATRCDIVIKDYGTYQNKKWKEQLRLYHHFDGYPSGVGKFLIEHVLPELEKSNNVSCDYIANLLLKHEKDDGFEITCGIHSDIEYRYIIDIPKKEIRCLEGHYSSWDSPKSHFIIEKEIDLSIFKPLNPEQFYK